MAKGKVRIRILPLKGIGGVGNAGDTAWMEKREADQWVKEGYVEIIPDADAPIASTANASGPSNEAEPEDDTSEPSDEAEPEEDHAIMKPQSRRRK